MTSGKWTGSQTTPAKRTNPALMNLITFAVSNENLHSLHSISKCCSKGKGMNDPWIKLYCTFLHLAVAFCVDTELSYTGYLKKYCYCTFQCLANIHPPMRVLRHQKMNPNRLLCRIQNRSPLLSWLFLHCDKLRPCVLEPTKKLLPYHLQMSTDDVPIVLDIWCNTAHKENFYSPYPWLR